MSNFIIYKGQDKDPNECWRWRLLDNNHKNIARSEEAFHKENITRSIKTMCSNVTLETPIIVKGDSAEDKSKYRFIFFESKKDSQWYWQLRAGGNSEIMAIGGESFSSKDSVTRSLENVRFEIDRTGTIEWENPDDDPAGKAKSEDRTPTKGIPGSDE